MVSHSLPTKIVTLITAISFIVSPAALAAPQKPDYKKYVETDSSVQTFEDFKKALDTANYRMTRKKWMTDLESSNVTARAAMTPQANASPTPRGGAGGGFIPAGGPVPNLAAMNPSNGYRLPMQPTYVESGPIGMQAEPANPIVVEVQPGTFFYYTPDPERRLYKREYLSATGFIARDVNFLDINGRLVRQESFKQDTSMLSSVNYYYKNTTDIAYYMMDFYSGPSTLVYNAVYEGIYLTNLTWFAAGRQTAINFYHEGSLVETSNFDTLGRLTSHVYNDEAQTTFNITYKAADTNEVARIVKTDAVSAIRKEFDFETAQAREFDGVTQTASYRFSVDNWRVAPEYRLAMGRVEELKLWDGSGTLWIELSRAPEELLRSVSQPYLQAFLNTAHATTGLTQSFIGGNVNNNPYGTYTYDMALFAIGDFSVNSDHIVNTYALNRASAVDAARPATYNTDYNPRWGLYNNVRIANFTQPNWWDTWDWSIHGGPSAWIGMAALQDYMRGRDDVPNAYVFAEQRASFLVSMQDTDGGIRMGPQLQFHPNGTSFYWNLKSTENNMSALYFLEAFASITTDPTLKAKYQLAADKIYTWLKTMYDKNENAFHRGAVYTGGVWVKDAHSLYASDTANWAPMERMLNDSFFGATRAARLTELDEMLDAVVTKTGVYMSSPDGPQLVGISYSPSSKALVKPGFPGIVGVVSIEWSSQYALRRLRMSQEWARLGDSARAAADLNAYNQMVTRLGTYFTNGVAPYAVWGDGSIAGNVATGHGWRTTNSTASLASSYYIYALSGYDPLLLRGEI